jgi:thymidylate kinase
MVHIIAIEGLDGSGKTYLASELEKKLNITLNDEINVVNQHFPFDRNIVETVNKLMAGIPTFRDYLNLVELFAVDRRNWYIDLCKKNVNDNRDIIVLADRYIISNPLYNVPAIIESRCMDWQYKDKLNVAKFLTDIVLDFDAKNRKPEGTILMNTSHGVRLGRIEKRSKRDAYELNSMISAQEMYMSDIVYEYKELNYLGQTKTVVTVPNDNKIEELKDFILSCIRTNGADI